MVPVERMHRFLLIRTILRIFLPVDSDSDSGEEGSPVEEEQDGDIGSEVSEKFTLLNI
jgi:hypothetical protein